jgi:hypothetical protein
MTTSSVNIHYHGTNTPPACHQDEVIHTMINSGETFQYDFTSPRTSRPDSIGITRIFTASPRRPCKAAPPEH